MNKNKACEIMPLSIFLNFLVKLYSVITIIRMCTARGVEIGDGREEMRVVGVGKTSISVSRLEWGRHLCFQNIDNYSQLMISQTLIS